MNDENVVCISVVGRTLESFLLQLKKSQELSNFVELRVDWIQNINVMKLNAIARNTNKKSILCCRSRSEGGNFKGTFEKKNEILQMGNTLGFDYLDIDLVTANRITIHNKKSKFILSYHNFVETPDLKNLEMIMMHMRNFNPDVLKISVMINSQIDVKILFQLLLNKRKDENVIVLGMGKKGRIVRLLAPLFGGYLTFSSLEEETQSAPGQIPYRMMKKFYRNLKKILH
ncbi:type I 3-dehydroquinate dehydratase [Coxiella endosymbiont of Amblyomma sculptum]|uniref:type I 3-dehydroquinate dehydratase n=1 Tax=Coxiella endosymbiont of Amblyomma sculptum TaxID=2487929 RepID=UPI00132EFC9E|nr:type I 3-dehydroquinate dehydratase [Coxiella endosymbiont of Amblyomma sculptum]QHG92651.1 type I 3-dehydroquinate dehydratase [Coxiella endosymbiont of Amblyomma sculptum]